MILLEVVCCSLEECLAAEGAGADRIELCASIELDGLTPPVDLLEAAKSRVGIPIVTMVRPRAGDFIYSDLELHKMRCDAERLAGSDADGLVLGCLTPQGSVDVQACSFVIDNVADVDLVFHKAIDVCTDVMAAARAIESIGFTRVLTSGGARTALEGASVLRRMAEDSRLQVLAGGGIRAHNVREVVEKSGVAQVHFGAFKGPETDRIERGRAEIIAARSAGS